MNSRHPVPRHKIPLKPGKTLANWVSDKEKVNSIATIAYFNNFSSLDIPLDDSPEKMLLNTAQSKIFGVFYMEKYTI